MTNELTRNERVLCAALDRVQAERDALRAEAAENLRLMQLALDDRDAILRKLEAAEAKWGRVPWVGLRIAVETYSYYVGIQEENDFVRDADKWLDAHQPDLEPQP